MRHLTDGSTAIVHGALAAGCDFFAGYPITPASPILMSMLRELPSVGGVGIQAEDEMTEPDRVFALPELADVETRAAVEVLDPGTAQGVTLAFVAALFDRLGYFPAEALTTAADAPPAGYREPGRRAAAAGLEVGRAPE